MCIERVVAINICFFKSCIKAILWKSNYFYKYRLVISNLNILTWSDLDSISNILTIKSLRGPKKLFFYIMMAQKSYFSYTAKVLNGTENIHGKTRRSTTSLGESIMYLTPLITAGIKVLSSLPKFRPPFPQVSTRTLPLLSDNYTEWSE